MQGDVLVCDIGGTNARFAVSGGADRSLRNFERLNVADFPDIGRAIAHYLDRQGSARPRNASIAVACPVSGDLVSVTNSHWRFSRKALTQEFGFEFLSVGNDFAALSEAVPYLGESQLRVLRNGVPVARANKLVVGPGTGLGVGGLAPAGRDGWAVIAGDGGHTSLAPGNEREDRLLKHLRTRFGRVSNERALCGDGLVNLYHFLAKEAGVEVGELTPAKITKAALDGSDPIASDAAIMFLDLLGGAIGDFALVLGALGGIYIGGGIMQHLAPQIDRSSMFRRMVDKGRLSNLIEPMPVFLISEPHAGLLGARRQFERELSWR